MVNSIQIFPPGFRVLNTLGQPSSGAQVQFFIAGTTTPLPVFADQGLTVPLGSTVFTRSDGLLVVSSGSSSVVNVYTGTASYKVQILDANGVVLYPAQDNILGALNTSSFLTTSSAASTLITPVVSIVGPTTIVAANRGNVIDANPTGGSFNVTLDVASNLGNGWHVWIRNGALANTVNIVTTSSQIVSLPMVQTTAFAIRPGEGYHISCNGTNFRADSYVPTLIDPGTTGIIQVNSVISAAPVSPVAGSRYIVSSGFTVGPFTAFAGNIIEANGQGGFFQVAPPLNSGWFAYVQALNQVYVQTGAVGWQIMGVPGQLTTTQRFTSGSGNYTPPAGVFKIRVSMCGPGAGGGAQSTNPGTAGSVATSFALWTANPGAGGAAAAGTPGAGGTGGNNSTGNLIRRIPGGAGQGGGLTGTVGTGMPGGQGGTNPLGGGGSGGSVNTAGGTAAANTGAGGGGGGGGSSTASGTGGGAGEYVEFWMLNPGVTAYVVGAGGAGGAAGVQAGGAGASGFISVEEFYFN